MKRVLAMLLTICLLVSCGSAAAEGSWLKDIWKETKEAAGEIWDETKEAAGELWDETKDTAGELWTGTKEFAGELWSGAKDAAQELWIEVKETAGELWRDIEPELRDAWDEAMEGIRELWSDVKAESVRLAKAVKEKLPEIYDKVKIWLTATGRDAAELLENGIREVCSRAGVTREDIDTVLETALEYAGMAGVALADVLKIVLCSVLSLVTDSPELAREHLPELVAQTLYDLGLKDTDLFGNGEYFGIIGEAFAM